MKRHSNTAGREPHRALTFFRVGAWAWVATGVGHLALEAMMALGPEDPAAARAFAAMRQYTIEFGGIQRDLRDIDLGMSLSMASAMIFAGVLCLLVGRSAPLLVSRSRALSGIALAASLLLLGLSGALFPAPPIVLFSVAVLTFAAALTTARPAPTAPTATA
ncbi:LIC_13387 family protein [Saccharomonospora piscinae]|uniref:LIC_13387 family protein n=1 Tax=Saccharomonospora piscinae TaxID=687388 RepID=UPI00046662F9|nr:hypothetical protein [Saccharomonospora piscinae]